MESLLARARQFADPPATGAEPFTERVHFDVIRPMILPRFITDPQFGQLGYYEIARRLDVTPTTVQALLRRARRHLRRSLANEAADH